MRTRTMMPLVATIVGAAAAIAAVRAVDEQRPVARHIRGGRGSGVKPGRKLDSLKHGKARL